VLKVFYYYKH